MPDLPLPFSDAATALVRPTVHWGWELFAGGRPGIGIGSLNPLSWLGTAASAALGDAWQAAMIALWSAGVWLLGLAFRTVDAFTTPDLTAHGPLGPVLPTTLWLGASVAVLLLFVQLGTALIRRDGQSIGRVLLGTAQFGAVWVAYLGVGAGLVAAAGGLERGILAATLHSSGFASMDLTASWPRQVGDTTTATVLGVLSLVLLIPAAFFYIVIMLVRDAALVILIATAPICAAGLLAETTRAWLFKALRWFISCLLIAPLIALVLGVGEKLAGGVVAGGGSSTTAAAGSAVVGVIVIAVGACCPLVLFRLLAFVDPGTASGAALRQSWSDAGGASGLLAGRQGGGPLAAFGGAAAATGADGRSGGESGAEAQTGSRLAGLLGPAGAAASGLMGSATGLAHRAVDIGSDVLGQAGVGAPGYSLTPTDQRYGRAAPGGWDSWGSRASGADAGSAGQGATGDGGGSADPPGGTGPAPAPAGPVPTPSDGPAPAGGLPIPSGPGSGAGAGAAGGAGGGAEAAAAAAAL